jgi:hypothetical protein
MKHYLGNQIKGEGLSKHMARWRGGDGVLVGKPNKTDQLEDTGVDGKVIWKQVWRNRMESLWLDSYTSGKNKWRAVAKLVKGLRLILSKIWGNVAHWKQRVAQPRNCPVAVNVTIELKNIKTASDYTGTMVSWTTPH